METVVPQRLSVGSHIRVVAPALSRAVVMQGNDNAAIAEQRLAELGLSISYAEHVDERDRYGSSSIGSRLADLHAAFADPRVDGILTVLGGYNSNELLPHLDFDLIAANPKVFCDYSDITALHSAIRARTGLVTYCGPHWSSFGMREVGERTVQSFRAMLMADDPVTITPGTWFTDDLWFLDQDNRTRIPTDGWWALRPGQMEGRIAGGNLCTLNLLQGTPFMRSIKDCVLFVEDCVLFVEDDELSNPVTFRRDLNSLMQIPDAESVQGIVIGRFQQASDVRREDLLAIIGTIPSLAGKPVLANVDLGHTNPMITLPLGGHAAVEVSDHPRVVLGHP